MKFIKKAFLKAYVFLCRCIYGYRDAVLFTSFAGKSYSDNPRAVSEKLHEMNPKLEIVWIFKNAEKKKKMVPEYIKCIDWANKYSVIKWQAIAKVVVDNSPLDDFVKSKKQYFIQLWHGDRAFKKILHDTAFFTRTVPLAEEKEGGCNLAVAGSAYGVMQFESAFRYKGEILKVGIPRNDRLVHYNAQEALALKDQLGISRDTKIALYAPTLRRENANDQSLQAKQDIDPVQTLAALKRKTNSEWVFLLRAHPAVVGLKGFSDNPSIIDVTSYDDMADLLLISDLLITDYSSSAGDFALLGRPIILFQADRNEYFEKDRELYFDMQESPYYVALNQAELEQIIETVSDEEFKENCDKILAFYETTETGFASEAVVKKITDWIYER